MISPAILYTTAALMALVGAACTALCLMWSIPAWRRRLAGSEIATEVRDTESGGLCGWPARIGSGMISAGIAAGALVGWYGCYCVLAAMIPASR